MIRAAIDLAGEEADSWKFGGCAPSTASARGIQFAGRFISRHIAKVIFTPVIMQEKKNITPVIFSEHLALLLKQRQLTQKQFAEVIEVSQPTVVKWLKGTIPKGDALNRAAEYFGLHPDYLLNPGRYRDPFEKAKEAAASFQGTEGEKQLEFERVLKEQTALLTERQHGWEASEKAASTESEWKRRALDAEKQLKKLRAILEGGKKN